MGHQAAPHHVGAVDMCAERRGTRSTPKGVERLRLPRRKPATGPLQVLHLPWCFAGIPPSPAAPPIPPPAFPDVHGADRMLNESKGKSCNESGPEDAACVIRLVRQQR